MTTDHAQQIMLGVLMNWFSDEEKLAWLGFVDELLPVRERAIQALLSERTIGQAAAKAGVHERTLRRWESEDEAFQAAYAAARQAAFRAGINRAQVLTVKAIDTLDELLDEKKHPHVRLGAARTVTELGVHQHDAETIFKKLDEIEAAQRQRRR